MLAEGFSSLFLVCQSAQSSVPVPPRPTQTGHMPRRVPREAWGSESPYGPGQVWLGQGQGEVTGPEDVLEPQVGQGPRVSIYTHTNLKGSPGTYWGVRIPQYSLYS